jgi:hypothetical protein
MSLPDFNSDEMTVWDAKTISHHPGSNPRVGGQKENKIQFLCFLLKTTCCDQQQLEISERIGIV